MKVKELVAELLQKDQEAEVAVTYGDGQGQKVTFVVVDEELPDVVLIEGGGAPVDY